MTDLQRRYNPDRISDKVEGPYPLRLIRLCFRDLWRAIENVDASVTTVTTTVSTGHDLLSATHTDVVAQAVTRGALVYGNATPAWDALPVGSTGTFLAADGTDIAYRLVIAGYPTFGITLTGQSYSP